jgi:hypothetical protein
MNLRDRQRKARRLDELRRRNERYHMWLELREQEDGVIRRRTIRSGTTRSGPVYSTLIGTPDEQEELSLLILRLAAARRHGVGRRRPY